MQSCMSFLEIWCCNVFNKKPTGLRRGKGISDLPSPPPPAPSHWTLDPILFMLSSNHLFNLLICWKAFVFSIMICRSDQATNSCPWTDVYFSFSEDWFNYPPYTWTAAQLESFLKSVRESYNIPGECDLDKLDLTGPELWCSTADDLKRRTEYGELLYEALNQFASNSQWESKHYFFLLIWIEKFNVIKTWK